MLDFAFEKFDVLDSGFFLVLVGEGEHFVGHVEAVGFSGGADAARGKQNVDAAAGAEVENGFTSVELGERGGIAAAERGLHGFGGNFARLRCVVEIGSDGIAAAAAGCGGCAATGAAAGGGTQRGLAVLVFHNFTDVRLTHDGSYLQI